MVRTVQRTDGAARARNGQESEANHERICMWESRQDKTAQTRQERQKRATQGKAIRGGLAWRPSVETESEECEAEAMYVCMRGCGPSGELSGAL
jgi:hypothetical protein